MTTSRLRRPTSVSMTQTFSPSRASAAPTLAVVVVLPTPPLPDVTTMALAFTLKSLLQEPAPCPRRRPRPPKGQGSRDYTIQEGPNREPSWSRSSPRQAGVLQQQPLGSGRLEHHRDLGARALAGEAHHGAGAELRVLHPFAPAERRQTVVARRLGRGLRQHRGPPDVAPVLRGGPAARELLAEHVGLHDVLAGDVLEEAAGARRLGAPERQARLGVHQVELLLRARDAHVEETPLLLELLQVARGAAVGDQVLLEADEEHDRELEALGVVQGHERDGVVVNLA